jgi:hypothetical protein
MKHLTNAIKKVNTSTVSALSGQTANEAVKQELRYRADKFIGRPQATEKYSVAELEKMGMIGIYENCMGK